MLATSVRCDNIAAAVDQSRYKSKAGALLTSEVLHFPEFSRMKKTKDEVLWT